MTTDVSQDFEAAVLARVRELRALGIPDASIAAMLGEIQPHHESPEMARAKIREAINKAGGVYKVASEINVHFTRIYAFLAGASMMPENMGALRKRLGDAVPDSVWANIAAPIQRGSVSSEEAT
jgi:hypothetical protein